MATKYAPVVSLKRLATIFAAQVSTHVPKRDVDSIIELRRLAVLIAIDRFGVDVEKAVEWLTACGFGDDVINGVRTYYKTKLDGVRLQAVHGAR